MDLVANILSLWLRFWLRADYAAPARRRNPGCGPVVGCRSGCLAVGHSVANGLCWASLFCARFSTSIRQRANWMWEWAEDRARPGVPAVMGRDCWGQDFSLVCDHRALRQRIGIAEFPLEVFGRG